MKSLKRAGLSRRDFNRYTLGAGAAAAASAAGLAPRFGGLAQAAPSAALGEVIERIGDFRADQMGVNEAFKSLKLANKTGAGWTRWTVQWNNVEKQRGVVDENYFRDNRGQSILDAQLATMQVAAMIVGTPSFAGGGVTAVPSGLGAPVMLGDAPNPENTFATFMYNLAKTFAGKMNVFEIWNEVEIPATGDNARYNTWAGSPAEYYQLVKVAAQAAKAANPNAKIVTSPYSYFKDAQPSDNKRLDFWDAFEAVVRENRAEAAGLIDAVALNLYRNPHDLWDRMWGAIPIYFGEADKKGFKERLDSMGLGGKELWLTEINAMPYDDNVAGWNPGARSRQAEPLALRLTMEEQAGYVWQALGIAAAAGWNKIFFQAMQDDNPVVDELWGLVRAGDANDESEGRMRPAYKAYTLASKLIGDSQARLFIRTRPDAMLSRHRQYASRYKWGAQAVVAQKGDLRTTVLWNNSPDAINADVKLNGSSATLIDAVGNEVPLQSSGGRARIPLAAASVRFFVNQDIADPINYYYVGGAPMILIETGVGDLGVDIANFTEKQPGKETGAGPDGSGQGDIDDRPNPQQIGQDPNRIGRLS
jgi:hypothetical protein